MYRYSNGQISLADFKQPEGMNLKERKRWVKKAQTLPWPEIEKRCAALFTNRKGNTAKPLCLALGVCIIQAEYGYSDAETTLQIQENPYLQYFCGYLDILHDPADGKKHRTYHKRARKDCQKYTRCRKHSAKMTRKAILLEILAPKRNWTLVQ